jgi:type III pantothenate kinase
MLLAIDVGNSQTVLGLFSGSELQRQWRVTTESYRSGDELAVVVEGLLRLAGLGRSTVTDCVLASVVPSLNSAYQELCAVHLGFEALVVGPGVKTGMPIMTNNPREVGADLIVDAVGAFEEYGGPCVVVDFRAAKLTPVELADPGGVIGKTTTQSMQAGAVYGFAGQVDGIVERMRVDLGGEAVSVATGGLAGLVFNHARSLDHLDFDLTLRGLEIVHRRNRRDTAS